MPVGLSSDLNVREVCYFIIWINTCTCIIHLQSYLQMYVKRTWITHYIRLFRSIFKNILNDEVSYWYLTETFSLKYSRRLQLLRLLCGHVWSLFMSISSYITIYIFVHLNLCECSARIVGVFMRLNCNSVDTTPIVLVFSSQKNPQ